jgi:hypothetical protein
MDWLKYFTIWWWQYIFAPLSNYQRLYEISPIKVFVCRWKGHPNGEIYYNIGGDEPDHHCKDCEDDLG